MPRSSVARKIVDLLTPGSPNEVDAIELLTHQHKQVDALFAEFEQLGERAFKARMVTFEKIAHLLTCHARIEEKIFYPAARKVDKQMTLESYEEHDVLKALMKKIALLEPGDETFLAKVTVLKEIVRRHVEEEEQEYFPKVKSTLGDDAMKVLGAEMQAAFEKLDHAHPEPTPRYLKKAK